MHCPKPSQLQNRLALVRADNGRTVPLNATRSIIRVNARRPRSGLAPSRGASKVSRTLVIHRVSDANIRNPLSNCCSVYATLNVIPIIIPSTTPIPPLVSSAGIGRDQLNQFKHSLGCPRCRPMQLPTAMIGTARPMPTQQKMNAACSKLPLPAASRATA